MEKYQQVKKEKRILDFGDYEHFCLKVLLKEGSTPENILPTEAAIELQKKYEEVLRSTIADVTSFYKNEQPRGEYVIVIEGKSHMDIEKESREGWMEMNLREHMNLYESEGFSKKEAMKMVAKDRGISKRDIYQQLLK